MHLLVTCEHGGNRIPPEYRHLFAGYASVLASHRGHDPGALTLARELARSLHAPLVASTVSRLLVELNRSPGHPRQWSERTRDLTPLEKERLAERYYDPYRREVQARIEHAIGDGHRVLHVSCHSFTPVLEGVRRRTDIGLLYDPRRTPERALCVRWQHLLRSRIAPLRVRRNYPYRGYDDGLTTFLRRVFPQAAYAGVEIEVNQKHTRGDAASWRSLRRAILGSLRELMQESTAS
jgi:predicted N-formylglutamate amidohydrolase